MFYSLSYNGGAFLIKGSIGIALFTGIFVGIVVFLSEYIFPPHTNFFIKGIIIGFFGAIGGLIGNKLFPNKP